MDLAIVLVAAGASTRMGFPKLWIDVGGQPLLQHAITAALAAEPTELVIVVSSDRQAHAAALCDSAGLVARVAAGGARRRDSVAAGLAASKSPWVAIHDAARALAPPELFRRGLDAAQASGAAVPVVPLKDTIKRVADARVVATPPRAEHVAVQTPQVFRRDLLERALALTEDDVTDEAALIEQLGIEVAVFAGDERAFKVTTPLDFALARALLSGANNR
jgi:2-C-methyl-D-erythritol 4-phosphate cytidylyltransferase/2-C-methyl-D-erythritol 2,4-cyclodiphosphate synthase